MLNVYLVERIDDFNIYDSIMNMVVVSENKKKALEFAFMQNWGDYDSIKRMEYLKVTKVNLNVVQVILKDFLYG